MRSELALLARLRAWLNETEDDPEARISLARDEVSYLVSIAANRDELRRGLEAIRQAHETGGPRAAVVAAGLQPRDRRAKLSDEETAAILLAYARELRHHARTPCARGRKCSPAGEAAEVLRRRFPALADLGHVALRGFLRRQYERLRDPGSTLARTFEGGLLRATPGWLDDLKLPHGHR